MSASKVLSAFSIANVSSLMFFIIIGQIPWIFSSLSISSTKFIWLPLQDFLGPLHPSSSIPRWYCLSFWHSRIKTPSRYLVSLVNSSFLSVYSLSSNNMKPFLTIYFSTGEMSSCFDNRLANVFWLRVFQFNKRDSFLLSPCVIEGSNERLSY